MREPTTTLGLIAPLIMALTSGAADAQAGDPALVRHQANQAFGEEDGTVGGSVTRAQFTRAVVKSEPVDSLSAVPATVKYVYYFTELKGFTGATIAHRWEHNGTVVSEERFDVGGPRWRLWSGRTLPDDMTGHWRVSVLDFVGRTIAVSEFDYGPTTTAQQQ